MVNKVLGLDAQGRDIELTPVAVSTGEADAGALINVYAVAGVAKVRNANANTGLKAHEFAPAQIAQASPGAVILGPGLNTGVVGLTPGSEYFSDPAVPGGVVTPAPTYTTGQICQPVGVAVTATELAFVIERIIKIT